jgi:hypothetical protein
MRAIQFWILLLASSLVCFLYITQIFLSRNLIREQRELVENQDTISQGAQYENAWKQLAIHIYQASAQDPALAAILKTENIGIHQNASANTGSAPATTPSAPPASSQTPDAP